MRIIKIYLLLFLFLPFEGICQELDQSFGKNGKLEIDMLKIQGLMEFNNSVLINDYFKLSSFNLNGNVNVSFGFDGTLDNPIGAEQYLINKCFDYNGELTILGCFQNGEYLNDLFLVQKDGNTGGPLSEFNLSYFQKEDNDEFFSSAIINDSLRLFGNESYTIDPTADYKSNAQYTTIDVSGNVINPSNNFGIIQELSDQNLVYNLAYELNNGQVIHFFQNSSSIQTKMFFSLTENFPDIQNYEFNLNQNVIEHNTFWINQIVQIDNSRILFTSTFGTFNSDYYNTYILDYIKNESYPVSFDFFNDDYELNDVVIADDGEIYITGKKVDQYLTYGFVSKLNYNLELDYDFGNSGIYEFELDSSLQDMRNSFYSNGNLYLTFDSRDLNNEKISSILRLIIKDDVLDTNEPIDLNHHDEIYPNPTADLSFLNITTTQKISNIKVYNTNGHFVGQASGFERLSNNRFMSGLYYLKVEFVNKSSKVFLVNKI